MFYRPTQERLFYNALVKFRDDQLENYEGQPLEYSASDYHHISRPAWTMNRRHSSRRQSSLRRRSNFSVLKDRNSRSSAEATKLLEAIESRDTPKATATRASVSKPLHTEATIPESPPEITSRPQTRDKAKYPEVDVRESLVEEPEPPEPSPYVVVQNKKPRVDSVKSFQSKTSLSKSRRGLNSGSAPHSASYKRNVSFRHIRNRSQGSASEKVRDTKPPIPEPKRPRKSSLRAAAGAPTTFNMERSPSLPPQPTTVRKSGIDAKGSVRIKKMHEAESGWKDDARKVSNELSQICEEAFNTSSVSTVRTSSTCETADTPITPVSVTTPEGSQQFPASNTATPRPLPEKPAENARFFTAAELAETRRRLIEHSANEGSDKVPSYLAGVITHLDRLIEQDKVKQRQKPESLGEQVSLSGPFVKPSNDAGYLPAISEELLTPLDSPAKSTFSHKDLMLHSHSLEGPKDDRNSSEAKPTVRLVSHPSLGSIEEIKPLNVRKKDQTTPSTEASQPSPLSKFAATNSRTSRQAGELDPVPEFPKPPTKDGANIERKWTLFKHKAHAPADAHPKTPSEHVKPINPGSENKGADAEPSTQKASDKSKGNFFMKFIKRKPKENPQCPPCQPTGKLLTTFS